MDALSFRLFFQSRALVMKYCARLMRNAARAYVGLLPSAPSFDWLILQDNHGMTHEFFYNPCMSGLRAMHFAVEPLSSATPNSGG
jgi:hypothetical protein